MRSIDQGKAEAMELLDNHWFYHNILTGDSNILLPKASCTSTSPKDIAIEQVEERNSPTSKPPNHQEHHHHHQERQSSFSRHPEKMGSMIKASQLIKQKKSHQSNKSLQELIPSSPTHPACKSNIHRHQQEEQHNKVKDNKGRERDNEDRRIILMARKWKSPSDLEHEEVKGFEDLGFVFGRGDKLNPILLKMIPGLRNSEEEPGSDVRRPYLSEAWFVRQSAPPMNGWAGRKSATEMKQQLKFWARAVASNVRQER